MKSLILRTRLNVTPVEMLMRGEGGLAPGSHIYGNLNGTRTEGITLSLAGLRGAGLQASDAELSADNRHMARRAAGCRGLYYAPRALGGHGLTFKETWGEIFNQHL